MRNQPLTREYLLEALISFRRWYSQSRPIDVTFPAFVIAREVTRKRLLNVPALLSEHREWLSSRPEGAGECATIQEMIELHLISLLERGIRHYGQLVARRDQEHDLRNRSRQREEL